VARIIQVFLASLQDLVHAILMEKDMNCMKEVKSHSTHVSIVGKSILHFQASHLEVAQKAHIKGITLQCK